MKSNDLITKAPTQLIAKVAGVEEIYKHIDWVSQKYGPGYVALGSDFCGFDMANEDVADISQYSVLTRVLREHGYPSDAIADIMGGNWYRFYSSLLKQG